MVQFSEIPIADLKNASAKSFIQMLLNDIYPYFYSKLSKLEDEIELIKELFDIEILDSTHQKIYAEFDELYRKEKLVLFPFLMKLEEENKKSENCTPFKHIRAHYTSMISHINSAKEVLSHFFINADNTSSIEVIDELLTELNLEMTQIQLIKERHLFSPMKSCGSCKSFDDNKK